MTLARMLMLHADSTFHASASVDDEELVSLEDELSSWGALDSEIGAWSFQSVHDSSDLIFKNNSG